MPYTPPGDNQPQTPNTAETIPLEELDFDARHRKSSESVTMEQIDQTVHDTEVEDPLLDREIQRLQNSSGSKASRFFKKLWSGPEEPKDEPPAVFEAPVLKPLEEVAHKFNDKVKKPIKAWILAAYLLLWAVCIYNVLYPYFTVPPHIEGSDASVMSLGCTDQLWRGKNAACGLNGENCVPSPDKMKSDVYVRCPALCDRSWTYSLIPIGDQRIKYRGYFVGGGDKPSQKQEKTQLTNPYRADSFICGSAVHAGLVSPFTGGCARLSYKSGGKWGFESAKGHYGVDDSISFSSFFPASFFFKAFSKDQELSQCHDPRLLVLVVNIFLGFPIVYLASGAVIFWTITTVGFWTIALATDPPVQVDSTDSETFASLLSLGLERFLPSCFILFALWTFSTGHTFTVPPDFKVSHLKRVFCFYPTFWLGVLNNISFDRLPVDRFTLADLKEQPGGAIAVSCIVLLIATCAVIQAYKVWQAGEFKRYLCIYLLMILGLVLIAHLPGLTLRIHHYILAMLLIPGCFTKGTTALLFQGILLGLFLSGAARWGLAAIGETDTSLRRDDPSGKVIPPEITGFDMATGLLSWSSDKETNPAYTGISILVNDLEQWVAENVTSVNFTDILTNSSDFSNYIKDTLKTKDTTSFYVRIGRKIMGTHRYSDYSNAAMIQWPSGDIVLPKPGLT